MSGTIPLSMTQQFDKNGALLAGGRLYFYVAGTVSTPQNSYQDGALTLPWPNPIILDATARVPQLFFADGLIKFRMTDVAGVVQFQGDGCQVIGASSGGGGGGGSVDATTVAQTGDIKKRYGTGTHTGWVQCNGKTIGPVGSGATELQSASAQALFIYLWAVDPNLVVSGAGRGTSGLNDWNLGTKTIALPDGRGTTLAGMDDMGNVAAGRLTTAYGVNGVVLGARGGVQSHTLLSTQVPATTFTALSAGSVDDINHAHYNDYGVADSSNNSSISGSSGIIRSGQLRVTRTSLDTGYNLNNHRHYVSGSIDGGGQPHPIVQPTMVITIYIKL